MWNDRSAQISIVFPDLQRRTRGGKRIASVKRFIVEIERELAMIMTAWLGRDFDPAGTWL